MRFRTPAFAFIVEAFSNKHKHAKGIVDDSEPPSAVRESFVATEEKPLPLAPTGSAIPKAPKPLVVLDSYEINEEAAEYLSEKDIHDLKEAFSLFDSDGDGVVNAIDLGRVMHDLGQDPTYSDLLTMIKEVDADGNGTIDFSEFMSMMALSAKADREAVKKAPEDTVELRTAFKLFDLNSDGYIDTSELKHIVHTLGNEVSDEEAADILRENDLNGDGKIDYEEFVKMMISQ